MDENNKPVGVPTEQNGRPADPQVSQVAHDIVSVKPKLSSEEELDTEIEQLRDDINAGDFEEAEEPHQEVRPQGADYYLTDYIQGAFSKASPVLKQLLKGEVEFVLSGSGKAFHYSFGDDVKISSDRVASESSIEANTETLQGIIRGQLNPQIAILSKRLKLSGNVMKGMYFLNLFRSY